MLCSIKIVFYLLGNLGRLLLIGRQPLLYLLEKDGRRLPLPRGGAGGPLAGSRGRLLNMRARGGGGLLLVGVRLRLPWRFALSCR